MKYLQYKEIANTVEPLYNAIPYNTTFYITWRIHGPQNLQRPIRTLIMLLVFFYKTNLPAIWWITARALDSEWTHMRKSMITAVMITSYFHTLWHHNPLRWSQYSSQVYSQRINGFFVSYSPD